MIALTKYAVPHLRPGSTIINTTSVTAFKGSAGMLDYSSTKGAIVSFTRSLAQQLAPKHIRVNAVAPGPVYTPLQPASRPADNMEDWSVGALPLHGRANMPAEMGPAYGMSLQELVHRNADSSLPRFGRIQRNDRPDHAPCKSLCPTVIGPPLTIRTTLSTSPKCRSIDGESVSGRCRNCNKKLVRSVQDMQCNVMCWSGMSVQTTG